MPRPPENPHSPRGDTRVPSHLHCTCTVDAKASSVSTEKLPHNICRRAPNCMPHKTSCFFPWCRPKLPSTTQTGDTCTLARKNHERLQRTKRPMPLASHTTAFTSLTAPGARLASLGGALAVAMYQAMDSAPWYQGAVLSAHREAQGHLGELSNTARESRDWGTHKLGNTGFLLKIPEPELFRQVCMAVYIQDALPGSSKHKGKSSEKEEKPSPK